MANLTSGTYDDYDEDENVNTNAGEDFIVPLSKNEKLSARLTSRGEEKARSSISPPVQATVQEGWSHRPSSSSKKPSTSFRNSSSGRYTKALHTPEVKQDAVTVGGRSRSSLRSGATGSLKNAGRDRIAFLEKELERYKHNEISLRREMVAEVERSVRAKCATEIELRRRAETRAKRVQREFQALKTENASLKDQLVAQTTQDERKTKAYREAVPQLKEKVRKLRSALDRTKEKLAAAVTEKEEATAVLQEEIQALREEKESALTVAATDLEAAAEEVKKSKKQRYEAEEKRRSAANALRRCKKRLAEVTEENADLQKRNKDLGERMDKRTSLRRHDEKALQDAKRTSNLARAEVEASIRRVEAMEKELRDRVQKERALRAKEECDALRSLAATSKEREAKVEEECAFRATQLKDAEHKHESEIGALNRAIETLRGELGVAERARAAAMREKEEVNERLAGSEERCSALTDELSKARMNLEQQEGALARAKARASAAVAGLEKRKSGRGARSGGRR